MVSVFYFCYAIIVVDNILPDTVIKNQKQSIPDTTYQYGASRWKHLPSLINSIHNPQNIYICNAFLVLRPLSPVPNVFWYMFAIYAREAPRSSHTDCPVEIYVWWMCCVVCIFAIGERMCCREYIIYEINDRLWSWCQQRGIYFFGVAYFGADYYIYILTSTTRHRNIMFRRSVRWRFYTRQALF